MNKVSIYWPDYTITRGDNATDLLRKVALKQWEEEVTVPRMKELLAERAWGWSNSVVDPLLPDEEFIKELGDTGMVFVWFGEGDPFRGLTDAGGMA
jgi:hypothetical protein